MGLKPTSSNPNCCLYGRCMQKFYMLLHFMLVYIQGYFIFMAIMDQDYILIAMPVICFLTYAIFYVGFCLQEKLFCIPVFLVDLISIPYFFYLAYYYYQPAFDAEGDRSLHIIAFACALTTAILKTTVFPVIYRAYKLLPYPEDHEMGSDMLTMGVFSIIFPLLLACAFLTISGGNSGGSNCGGCASSGNGCNCSDDSDDEGPRMVGVSTIT
ncbi:unnamed protein product [Bursaphelenchus xylophilus]|uniref:(pine wood nematode) hypothetical protein n=1 Tax=Bursaphelenchus xylophilus TaxID=6326 RepID=A0A1I7RIK6_BURXY|nr:unnamed protein product [Bursaphelenchus xylophilus]CAG9118850.1 unnamed protein product [Bursaphelenchus xylophilus]